MKESIVLQKKESDFNPSQSSQYENSCFRKAQGLTRAGVAPYKFVRKWDGFFPGEKKGKKQRISDALLHAGTLEEREEGCVRN